MKVLKTVSGRGKHHLAKTIAYVNPTWDIEVTVVSTRGRYHPMEAAAPDQPQSDQDLRMSSTAIKAFRYSFKHKILDIEFVPTGAVYRYYNVPHITVKMFKTAGSKGRYFNRVIRGQFNYVRMV
jgi:hypothetical protein